MVLGTQCQHLCAAACDVRGQVQKRGRAVTPGRELGLHLLDRHGRAVLQKLQGQLVERLVRGDGHECRPHVSLLCRGAEQRHQGGARQDHKRADRHNARQSAPARSPACAGCHSLVRRRHRHLGYFGRGMFVLVCTHTVFTKRVHKSHS